MRKAHKIEIESARQGALWCKLMGIFVQIQAELEGCQFFRSGDPVLVELELEFFELTFEKVENKVQEIMSIIESDESLYEELDDLLSRDKAYRR